jgi:hypothetical protein
MDMSLWVGLATVTAALYMLKWLQGRRKVTVYRISPASLKRSKDVMVRVLPLVEDGRDEPLDETCLPCDKATIKSAAKILAYHFWKVDQHEELARTKHCFVSLSRFQDRDLDPEARERRATRERERLVREFDCYLAHTSIRKN